MAYTLKCTGVEVEHWSTGEYVGMREATPDETISALLMEVASL